jgi:TonB family protein
MNMRTETAIADNSFTSAGNTQQYCLPGLHTCCDEVPRHPLTTRFSAVFACLASLLIHTCVIAGSVLLSQILPPAVLPLGEAMEVNLVTLRIPASGSQSSGPDTATPPAAISEKADTESAVAPGPSASTRRDVVSAGVQPQKNARILQQTQKQTFEESGKTAFGKDPQPAGHDQSIAVGGTGHGREAPGNGSLPAPFGAHINPWPVYPEIARQRGQSGEVALLVNVDMHGNPTKVALESSSGYSLLDQEAIKTIRRWKFTPASSNGEAVPGTVRVPVTFRLQ